MTRDDLKILAEGRVVDADVLLALKRWPAAYYLLGYSVECGLKACAARQFREHEVPDKKVVEHFYTHDLKKLLGISGLKQSLDDYAKREPEFEVNWSTVSDWNEASRYDYSITEAKARDMRLAVADETTGVLTWLKAQW